MPNTLDHELRPHPVEPPLAPARLSPGDPATAGVPTNATPRPDGRIDEYSWLRNRSDPAVIAHLEAENVYTESMCAPSADLREVLFNEIRARVQETDLSVPTRKGPYEYYVRTLEGEQYPRHCRRPVDAASQSRGSDGNATDDLGVDDLGVDDLGVDDVILDENLLAKGHEYFALGSLEISPDHRVLAYTVDTTGDEMYTLRIRHCGTGADLPDAIENVAPGVAWSADAAHVFYTTLDDAMRPWKLWLHTIGTGAETDLCLRTEDDDRFYVGVGVSATDELIIFSISSQVTTEVWVLRATDPHGQFSLVAARRQDIEYGVDHHRAADGSERLVIVTNDGDENFQCVVAPVPDHGETGTHHTWQIAVESARPGPVTGYATKLDGVDVFRRHFVLHERVDGLQQMRVVLLGADGACGEEHVIAQTEPVNTVWSAGNAEFDTSNYRFAYSSPVTPSSVFEYDLDSRDRRLLKQQPVLGDFTADDYVCERAWASASDGVKIPISTVRHRRTDLDGTAPGVLYGYGSYEISNDPSFSIARLSLLDRGAVFAIAHVRGGGELGRRWYLDGKLLKKRNTFTDFIACAEHLISSRIVDGRRLAARGGSAGGLLVGAAINLRPEIWRAVVAEVPFVDVVNTMLDESLPLTAIEWEEWGNPAEAEYFEYMRSYAPYENIAGRSNTGDRSSESFPDLLVTAGLNDPRVGYWEPAKWVARLRAAGWPGPDSDRHILLRTELGAGHGGPSGRYEGWREEAFVLAFLITALGLAPESAPAQRSSR